MKLSQKLAVLSALLLSALSIQVMAQNVDLESAEGKAGYSIGVNIGMNLANQGISDDLDINALLQGLGDAVNDDLKMSEDEIVAAIQEFSALQQAKAEAVTAMESKVSEEFLANNAVQPGVMTTASGLQYLVLQEGEADSPRPTAFDSVNVHYHGTLINGNVFDSSVERGEPVSFPLNGVIPGWTEGLQLMKVGEKFRFFIPSELAYGEAGAAQAGIGPNVALVFEVELLGIE